VELEKPILVRVNDGERTRVLSAKVGKNLRELLLEGEASPYRGAFRTLNCQGLGVCGSCRVKVFENGEWWSRRACQIRCFQSLEIELE
jgi:ferredoxin